jgi:hypothetical protein
VSTSSAGELLIEAEQGNKLALGRLIPRIETILVSALQWTDLLIDAPLQRAAKVARHGDDQL